MNLLDNAVKFTDAGSVKIGVRPGERDDVIISVRDTGVGIDADVMARIFEPFGRAHEDRTGTGLGLTICRDLVQRMGGSLDLESTVGQGTLFTIRVPLPPALDHEVTTPSPPEDPTLDSEPPFVLVVEDSPINQLLAAGQLDQLGCRHEIAATGMEALAAFSRNAFDLVLMDWHLPDMDGLETTQWLRADRSGRRSRADTGRGGHRPHDDGRSSALSRRRHGRLPPEARRHGRPRHDPAEVAAGRHRWPRAGRSGHRPSRSPTPTPSNACSTISATRAWWPRWSPRSSTSSPAVSPRSSRPTPGADPEAMRRAAHTLKSTSAIVGASDLASVAADIESRARAAETPLDDAVADLEAAAERVTTDFTEILTTLEQP